MGDNGAIPENKRIITGVKIAGISVRSDNKITLAGMSGQGKTTFMKALLKYMPNTLIYDPLDQYGDTGIRRYVPKLDNQDEFEYVAGKVWQHGNILFAIEESEMYIPEGKPLTPNIKTLILRGRNRGCGVMANTRRLAMLNKTMFGLSDHNFIFRLFTPNDIDYCRQFIGQEYANKLRSLINHGLIYYGNNGVLKELPPLKL